MKTEYEQGTGSVLTDISNSLLKLDLGKYNRPETYSSQLNSDYAIVSLNEYSIIEGALKKVSRCTNHDLSVRAKKVLYLINDGLSQIASKVDISGKLTRINAFIQEEDSIYLEWIYPEIRAGFILDKIDSESSWYLVTTEIHGNIQASGILKIDCMGKIIMWIISLLLITR